ncbi:MAG: TOBE domain-containing protein [Sulfurimonas sp.]|uniref:TOBE domain-containing protein n=1 Tax=Sulfurimonas sp. TaxID=2022749 RepID=UPI0025D81D04|nr:TOBE domain-containing protein [Sulfurimonas sp.]MCK9492573.1 TOBE domain-containing protein [Sulfurimonas sp.]
MRTSARNELSGKITEIKSGGVMSEVVIKVSDEISVCATITNDAKESLSLSVGGEISAIIKSSLVILSKEKVSASARNNIKTVVVDVTKGAVNSTVKLKIADKNLCAIVTNDAIEDLQIKKNDSVYAIFKASSVILVA